jgi:hypothetical protein
VEQSSVSLGHLAAWKPAGSTVKCMCFGIEFAFLSEKMRTHNCWKYAEIEQGEKVAPLFHTARVVPRNNSQRTINSVYDANGIIVLYKRFPHHVLNGRVKGDKNMRLPFI